MREVRDREVLSNSTEGRKFFFCFFLEFKLLSKGLNGAATSNIMIYLILKYNYQSQ